MAWCLKPVVIYLWHNFAHWTHLWLLQTNRSSSNSNFQWRCESTADARFKRKLSPIITLKGHHDCLVTSRDYLEVYVNTNKDECGEWYSLHVVIKVDHHNCTLIVPEYKKTNSWSCFERWTICYSGQLFCPDGARGKWYTYCWFRDEQLVLCS